MDVTALQEAALVDFFNNLRIEDYTLSDNQCTTTAIDALSDAGIMSWLGFIRTPDQLRSELNHRKNQMHWQFLSVGIDWNFSGIDNVQTQTVPFY